MTTLVSRNKENILQPTQEGSLDVGKANEELKELKRNLVLSQELNTKLHEHLTSLTANYHADLSERHLEIVSLRTALAGGSS
jgi:hypothetical protein